MTKGVGRRFLVHDHVHRHPAGLERRAGKLIDFGHDPRIVSSQLTTPPQQLDEKAHALTCVAEQVLQREEADGGEALLEGDRLRERMRNPSFDDPYVEPVLDRRQALFQKLSADAAPPVVRVNGQTSELAHEVRIRAHLQDDRCGSDDEIVFRVLGDEHQCLVGKDQLLDLEFFVVLRIGVVLPVRRKIDIDDALDVRVLRLPDHDHRSPPIGAGSSG